MKKPLLLSSLSLFISCLLFAQSSNNSICNATTVGPSSTCGSVAGSLWKASSAGAPASSCGTTNDIWFKFSVPTGAYNYTITVTPTGSNLTAASTYVEVFKGITDCSDVSPGTSLGCANVSSPMVLTGLSTGTHYVRVFVNGTTTAGNSTNWAFSICVTYLPPSNDECTTAKVVASGSTVGLGTVWKASTSSSIPTDYMTGTPDDDVWYKFIAANTYATITLSSIGTELAAAGAMIQAFSGTCGSLASIGCGNSVLNITGLTAGDLYYVRVYSSASGGFGGSASGSAFKISVTPSATSNVGSGRMKEVFQQTIISAPEILYDPWDICYGPDGYLWITESKGYRIYRVNPVSGVRDTVLNISYNSTFFTSTADKAFNVQFDFPTLAPQGGLAALAIHPKFMDATAPEKYVYVSYIRSSNGVVTPAGGRSFTNSLVRFTYNPATKRLESPETICDTLPGSNDHNSQRMIIAPVTVGGEKYLFYASGDMGGGQLNNNTRLNKAQNKNSYEGKILRFNLAPTGSGSGTDPWIPEDNPYNGGNKSAVWVTGIRNNQGFAYDTVKNVLFGSSHGPYSDDEINIIERKRNYGHPYVIGKKNDLNYNGSGAGANANSTCPTIVSETHNADSIDLADPTAKYKDPLFTAYPRTTAEINAIWAATPSPNNGGWPSEGWSGMDLYTANLIPGWKNSLLIGSLKWGRVLRLKLDDTDTLVVPTDGKDTVSYFGSINRFRDVTFSPDGKDMYVIMDKSTTTSGPSAAFPVVPSCPGCLQKYTFLGYAADGTNRSTIPDAIDVTDVAVNTCTPGTTITISGANNNLWVPITGPDGNILAEIKANGQDLGNITSSVYKNKNTDPLRIIASKRYLDRNITISVQFPPSSPVDVRLYISKVEFDHLRGDPMSMVNTIGDLKIMKNNDPCRPSLVSTTTFITVDHADAHGLNGYVLQGKVNSFSSFYFSSSPTTLPVELLSFTGSLVNNSTLLQWETTNEKNAENFIVERSIDSRSFIDIGSVAAHGNTIEKINYSFTDINAANQSSATLYYRLRMVDIDGRFKYSNTVTVSLADIAGKLTLAPNPASHEVKATITSITEGPAKWHVVDNSGRVVLAGTVLLKTGKNVLPININSLKGGVYYLILSGTGIDQRVKLQKI